MAADKQSPQRKLTKADLVQYFAAGCKPSPDDWRIGTEHEKLAFVAKTKRRATYEDLLHILRGLRDRHGWKPIEEKAAGRSIVGCKKDGMSVTLEPAGQLELSGAPLPDLHKCQQEVHSHLREVTQLGKEVGVRFFNLGYDPSTAADEDTPKVPKPHYGIMRDHIAQTGDMGSEMTIHSASIQVNLDYSSEEDFVEMMRVSMALQPIATALFANSPFRNGKPSGYLSTRSFAWTDTEPERCGILPFVFEDGFGFQKYVDFLLTRPLLMVNRNSDFIPAEGQSFVDFMEGRLPALPGEHATEKDWDAHMAMVWPEVRAKKFIEMRGADEGPYITALSAFWVGLLYHKPTQQEAAQLISHWLPQQIIDLRNQVPRDGLKSLFCGSTVQEVAQQVLALSRNGLEARGLGEERFLRPLEEIASSGKTLADRLLERYHGEWAGSIGPLYEAEDLQY